MPKIINAYSDANNSIADSLKSIGQSIWGDEAKNEGLRQNAEKLRQEAARAARENNNAEPYARAMRDNDMGSARYYGALHGLTPEGIGVANRVTAAGRANGNYDDPMLGTSILGAGGSMASTPEGQRRAMANQRAMEQDKTDASKYTPIYTEDPRTGVKSATGGFNTKTGEQVPFGQPRGFNQPANPNAPMMSNPGGQQPGFTPAASLADDYGNPISVPSAPLHMMHSADENGQPILSEQGKQRLLQLEQQNPGYGGQLLATVLGHIPPPSSRSKQNNVFMRDLLSVDPGYEAGVAGMRNKTYQDVASSGKTGQIATAVDQGINHMGEVLIPAAAKLNTWHSGSWGPLTSTMNSIYTAKLAGNQDPRLVEFNVAREGFANEFAKIFRTTGMSEQEIEHQRHNFAAAQTPEEVQAAARSAIHLLHGSLDAREASIQRVLGPDARRAPMVSKDTAAKIAQIEAWANGGAVPQSGGKNSGQLPQGAPGGAPATALPPGPTGHPPSINDPPQTQPPAGFRQAPDGKFYSEKPGPNGRYQMWTP